MVGVYFRAVALKQVVGGGTTAGARNGSSASEPRDVFTAAVAISKVVRGDLDFFRRSCLKEKSGGLLFVFSVFNCLFEKYLAVMSETLHTLFCTLRV